MPDGGQDVGQLAVLGTGVVDVVGDDDRQPEALGQRRRLRDEPVVVGEEVMRQLDEEAARGRAVAGRPKIAAYRSATARAPVTIADPQPARQLPVPTAGQRDQSVRVLGQERLAEPGHALRAGHVGVRHEPAQAPPPDLRACQQDEVRPADPLTDPTQVLLDRRPMARQAGARRPGPDGHALGHVRGRRVSGDATGDATTWPTGGDDDPVRVGDDRVEQFDLETDDGMEPRRLRRAGEADRPVQAGMVGDGQPGQPQLDGPLDEVVGCGRPVEEREVGVAVEFGVRGLRHGSLRVGSG